MSIAILWGLIAFLVVDLALLVLVVRMGGNEKSPAKVETPPPAQATQTARPDTAASNNKPTTPLAHPAPVTRPIDDDRVFTFDALEVPDEQTLVTQRADHEPLKSSSGPIQVTQKAVEDEQLARISIERNYLREQATKLEAQLAALNDTSSTRTDYQLGMRAILEEELHSIWSRLSELAAEESRANHAAAK